MSKKESSWVDAVKAEPLSFCVRWSSKGEWHVNKSKIIQRFECSEGTARKLATIIEPLVEEENRKLRTETAKSNVVPVQ